MNGFQLGIFYSFHLCSHVQSLVELETVIVATAATLSTLPLFLIFFERMYVQKAEYVKPTYQQHSNVRHIVTNFTHKMNFQFEEPNVCRNSSIHLSIALHLILDDKKEGRPPHSGLVISFLVILWIILVTLGNFLLVCMIWYEKYGMDSKKRTVTNMLLSRIIFVQIFGNTFVMPLSTIGLLFGVFSKYQSH